MKILQVITSLRMGGAERLVAELAKRISGGSDTVEVLLFDGTATPLYEELESAGIKVHSLGRGEAAMHNPLLLFKLRRFLNKGDYDIVHTHNTPCQLLTALAAPKRKLVTTEHNTGNRRRFLPILKKLDRRMYSRYDHIVCVSQETQDNLSRWLGNKRLDARMSVIPNGIDIGRIANALPAAEMMEDGRHNVLMVSAFRPEKDQQTLIMAMSHLPGNYTLFLAGGAELPGHKALMEACQRLARDLGLGERVRFLGLRDDVPALLAASDAVVLSSLHEGMSLSILEAMASGRPLIASDVAGMREIVEGAGLLFPAGDAAKLADAIRVVCEDSQKAGEISRRCKERARQYDIAAAARRYKELYEGLII